MALADRPEKTDKPFPIYFGEGHSRGREFGGGGAQADHYHIEPLLSHGRTGQAP
jgi:hypothetical protein